MTTKKEVTIPKGKDDNGYRYRRDLLKVSYQGNQRTILENLDDIAKSLIIPVEYPYKFIGYELGSQTEIKNNQYTLSGKHSQEKLEEYLEKFISKYILCQSKSCGLPEIKIIIPINTKTNEIKANCTACPHISTLDNKHKIGGYIIKNPPKILSQITGKNIDQPISGGDKSFTPDIKAIKASVKKIEEAGKNNPDNLDSVIESVLKDPSPSISNPDCKYLILFHGLYSKDLYEVFEQKTGHLKKVISQEKNISKEEVAYHILASLINLIFSKFAKDEAVFNELQSQISSLCYILYIEEIFTEKFIVDKLIKNNFNCKNFVYSSDLEKKFIDNAAQFIDWFVNAPYEDEERTYNGIKNTLPQQEINNEKLKMDLDEL